MKNKEVAKTVICTYLKTKLTPENICTTYDIQSGDDKLLLKHIKALKNIFENAIKEIEGEKKKAINNYVEFLNALDAGEKKIEVTEEFFEWLNDCIDLVRTHDGSNEPAATYNGIEIYIKEREER